MKNKLRLLAVLTASFPLFLTSSITSQDGALVDDSIVGHYKVRIPAGIEGWWTTNVSAEDFSDGTIHIHAPTLQQARISSKKRLHNHDFTLDFEFMLKRAENPGSDNGFFLGYQYPTRGQNWKTPQYYWKVNLSDHRLLVYARNHGRYELGTASPEVLSRDKWYRLRVVNEAESVTFHVFEADGGRKIGSSQFSHDRGVDSPTPLEFTADAELPGIQRNSPAPLNTVLNQYNLRHSTLKGWALSASAYLRKIQITEKAPTTTTANTNGRELLRKGDFVISSQDDQALEVTHDGKHLLSLPGSPAYLAVAPESPASAWEVHQTDVIGDHVVQSWRSKHIPAEIRLKLDFPSKRPYFGLSVEVENLVAERQVLDIVLNLISPNPRTSWQHAYAFPFTNPDWKDCFEKGYYPFEQDLAESPIACSWGTRALGWGAEKGSNLFLPIVALMNNKTGPGTVVCWDNATSLKFMAGAGTARIQRRFFLNPEIGFTDGSLDVGDGGSEVPHRIIIGQKPEIDWTTLYNDFYLDALPLYKFDQSNLKKPLVPGLFGGHEGFFTTVAWTEEIAREQAMAGVRYAHLFFNHANHPKRFKEYNGDRSDWIHKYGMMVMYSDNCMVAPISTELFHPEQHFTKYDDALIYSLDGHGPLINWEGMLVNQSPQFSYGQDELQIVKGLVEKHDIGHGYLDLYQFGDMIQWDGGDWELFAPFFKAMSGCKLNVTYGSPSWGAPDRDIYQDAIGNVRWVLNWTTLNGKVLHNIASGAYDTFYSKWKIEDLAVRQRVLDLMNRNVTFGFAIGQARLVTGKVFRSYQFVNPAGDIFLTAYNPAEETQSVAVEPDFKRLGIERSKRYSVFEWDADTGAALRAAKVLGSELPTSIDVSLRGGQVKTVVILENSESLVRDYMTADVDSGRLASFTTGRFLSTKQSSGVWTIAVDAVPDRKTVTRLIIPDSATLQVEGAKEHRVESQGGSRDVFVTHGNGPTRIVVR